MEDLDAIKNVSTEYAEIYLLRWMSRLTVFQISKRIHRDRNYILSVLDRCQEIIYLSQIDTEGNNKITITCGSGMRISVKTDTTASKALDKIK